MGWNLLAVVEITGLQCPRDFCKDKGVTLKRIRVWVIEKFLSHFYVSCNQDSLNASVQTPILTHRTLVILFSADTPCEISLSRNRQWFNQLELGKIYA